MNKSYSSKNEKLEVRKYRPSFPSQEKKEERGWDK